MLAIVLVTAAVAGNGSPEPAAANPGETTSAAPTEKPTKSPTKKADDRIRVSESDYLGRDKKDAKRELEGLGFRVEEQKAQASSPDQEKDTVAAVRPHGLVEPGTTVTLVVWQKYEAPEEEHGDSGWYDVKPPKEPKGWSKGKGNGKGHDD